MNLTARPLTRTTAALILIAAAVLAATGHLDVLVDKSGGAILSDSNNTYLNDSFDRSMKGFLVLSAIKSGIAVIEGSGIGVGFNLEVGDIAQSIYDYVDVAWKTALAGGTVLLLIQLMLQTMQLIDHWCLFALLLVVLSLFLLRWFFPKQERLNRILREALMFVSVLTIAFYMILPLSIAGAAFLSKQITQPLVTEAQQGFESLQEELTPRALDERFFPGSQSDDSLWSYLDLRAKLQNSREAIIKMAQYVKEITEDSAIWTIKIIAGYLFDCIIFPLAFFVVGYILTKNLLAYVIDIRREHSVRKDFEMILAKYYGK
ncbi:MAG: hypothetical protein JRJ20_17270 [Deltaproteobacteria bacterium]|nr:hypothetical protein [Deltaproteobacteria bacterium]